MGLSMGRWKVLPTVSAVLFVASLAHAQTALNLMTEQGDLVDSVVSPALLGGLLPGASYAPSGIFSVRPGDVIQCLSKADQATIGGRRVTFDGNGVYEPTLVTADDLAMLQRSLPSLATIDLTVYGGELLHYGDADYLPLSTQAGNAVAGTQTLALVIDGVRGGCFLVDAEDAVPATPVCNVVSDEDSMFAGRFEMLQQGTLDVSVSAEYANSPLNTRVSYTYTLRAVGGPVYDIDLGEQFPFHTAAQSGFPVYARSLKLEELWSCRASEKANCDLRSGREKDGVGYSRLRGATLAESGACLTVTAERAIRTDGMHGDVPYSNRLHVGAVYRTAPTATAAGTRVIETKRLPFSP